MLWDYTGKISKNLPIHYDYLQLVQATYTYTFSQNISEPIRVMFENFVLEN